MRKRFSLWMALVAGMVLTSCTRQEQAAPTCDSPARVGIVAQSVPDASFVPCVATLPPGWQVASFRVARGGARLSLESDRATEPVDVEFDDSCDVRGATPVAPRDEGVRTYVKLDGIAPRYSGHMRDVFPGGCVTYAFDFERGPHIALTDEFRSAVELYPRRELRQDLRDDVGVSLDP